MVDPEPTSQKTDQNGPNATSALVESLITSGSPSDQTPVNTSSSGSIIVPSGDETPKSSSGAKKSNRRGILFALFLLLFLTIPVIIYYVSQPKQLADVRSKAQSIYPCPNVWPLYCNTDAITCTDNGGTVDPSYTCTSGIDDVCCRNLTLGTPTPFSGSPTPTTARCDDPTLYNCTLLYNIRCSATNLFGGCPSDLYTYTKQVCTNIEDPTIKHECNEGCQLDSSCFPSGSVTPSPIISGGETVCYWEPDNSCGLKLCNCDQRRTAVEYCDNGTGPVFFASQCSIDPLVNAGCIGNCAGGPTNTPTRPPDQPSVTPTRTPTATPTSTPTNTPTPSPTPAVCIGLKVYKDDGTGTYVDITLALQNKTAGVEPGTVIRIAVVPPPTATRARIRVTDAANPVPAWVETTTKNLQGEFFLDYTITGYDSIFIEAETLTGTVWK